MTFTGEKKQTERTRAGGSCGFSRSDSGGPVSELPNSLMSDMMDFDADMPSEAVVRREMYGPVRQIPTAEAEADRLSSGVRGTSPGDIRREMGRRLGADFSGVRFHSGSESEAQGAQIGARAWTHGSDVFFGQGGFDPQIAAHELVHTIQQGAVSGSVRNSAPAGSVQLWPWSKKKKEERKRHIDALADEYRASLDAEKRPAADSKSLDESGIEFELEGLNSPVKKKEPSIDDNIIQNGMLEKDNISVGSGMPEDDLLSVGNGIQNDILKNDGKIPAGGKPDVPNDLLAAAGRQGNKKQEELLGLDTISLQGMDQVNEQEKQDILKDFVSISNDSDSDRMSNPAHEKAVSKIKNLSGKIGVTRHLQMGANSTTQLGMLARNHSAMDDTNVYTSDINPAVGAMADVLGIGTGLAGLGTGAFDTYKNIKNLRAGGEKSDILTSALDTAASGTTLTSSGIGMLSKVGSISGFGEALTPVTDFTKNHTNVLPGLNIATGGATAISGGIQAIKGMKSIGKIDEQIKALEKKRKKGGLDSNQEQLLRTFRQGRRISEFNRTSGALKTLSGSITAGTGIAALATGPLAPLTAALAAIAGVATGVTKFIYDKVKKRRMRADITAEDMGINWADEMKRVRRKFRGEKLTDKEVRAIILKSHGYAEGTRTAAYKEITKKRATHLMQTAQGVGEEAGMAQKVISALGIHRKHGRYLKGALKLLTKKLG